MFAKHSLNPDFLKNFQDILQQLFQAITSILSLYKTYISQIISDFKLYYAIIQFKINRVIISHVLVFIWKIISNSLFPLYHRVIKHKLFLFLKRSQIGPLQKIPQFHLISWFGNCDFPQNFETRKPGEITLFFAVN